MDVIEACKYIAEYMGKCWHEWEGYDYFNISCKKCGKDLPNKNLGDHNGYRYSVSLDALIPVWEKLDRETSLYPSNVINMIRFVSHKYGNYKGDITAQAAIETGKACKEVMDGKAA